MNATDPYADWDAAYVLGSLSSAERREYEQHLTTCAACSAALAELAGIPGLLAKVPKDEAVALTSEVGPPPVPDTLLPRMIRSAVRRRRRTRGMIAGIIVASTAAAAAVALVIPLLISSPQVAEPPTTRVALSQVVDSPITAKATLSAMKWGTRIEVSCSYAAVGSAGWDSAWPGASSEYAMYVVDGHGASTEVATWTAYPGTTVTPSGTTSLSLADISAVQIRSPQGAVLLSASP